MIEVLAPAGSYESLQAALNTGADAVYLGLNSENNIGFSARRNAKNFTTDELYKAANICRLSGVKLYVAMNTLIFDEEIPQAEEVVNTILKAGADAIIIQDLSLIEIIKKARKNSGNSENLCKIHASTQMTINSVSGVLQAKELGFSRVVLARELSFCEIAEITEIAIKNNIETEVFIHGALCVSVSGQCFMSAFLGGAKSDRRSANRGLCAQPCRLDFTVGDEVKNALSLKELSIVSHIKELESVGVTAVKIEGRMRRAEYVAAAVNACRKALGGDFPDSKVSDNSLLLLKSAFSRGGFTEGYFSGNITDMRGFRGREDVLQSEKSLKELQKLYKEPYKRRTLNISANVNNSEIICRAECDGVTAELNFPPAEVALTRQTTADEIKTRLSKLGGTIFAAGEIICKIDDGLFLSAARINEIRREIVEIISESLVGVVGI